VTAVGNVIAVAFVGSVVVVTGDDVRRARSTRSVRTNA
jgi:hypothetical protein